MGLRTENGREDEVGKSSEREEAERKKAKDEVKLSRDEKKTEKTHSPCSFLNAVSTV